MSTSPTDKGESPKQPAGSPVVLLLGIAGDTTWRMFAPILVLGAIGVWCDLTFHTKPWCTIVAIIVALGISGLLIKNQLNKGRPTS